MKNRFGYGVRQKNKLKTGLFFVAGIFTVILTVTAGTLIYLNFNNISKIKASATGIEGGGNNLNNGEILSEFTWDKDPVTMAIIGPDAIKLSATAHSAPDGRKNTNGLSPGKKSPGINLVIEKNELFKQDGIDVSIDFRRNEASGDFITRGNRFNFGMDDGFISIKYSIENKAGKTETIEAKTFYEIPEDDNFRNFRFMYSPASGKAEIFVNDIVVWQRMGENNTPLSWNENDDIVIGKNIDGGGTDRAVLDNLVIRTNGNIAPIAESLVNFSLEGNSSGVKIKWSSLMNENVENFTIQRSMNGTDFSTVTTIESRRDTSEIGDYVYIDKVSSKVPIMYYRIKQTFRNGKFVTHSLSAIKLKSNRDFAIDRVSPSPFLKNCDISYFIPTTGIVWLQIADKDGNVIKTDNFTASKGRNIHTLKDMQELPEGTYTFSLIFDNKKVSAKAVKGG